jgi:hypothetical protein
MTKREIFKDAYDWLDNTHAADNYGKKAAKAFAKEIRQDLRKNFINGCVGDGAPYVICGDDEVTSWTITETFENLLNQSIRDAVEWDEKAAPEKLTELMGVLQRVSAKANRVVKRLRKKAAAK